MEVLIGFLGPIQSLQFSQVRVPYRGGSLALSPDGKSLQRKWKRNSEARSCLHHSLQLYCSFHDSDSLVWHWRVCTFIPMIMIIQSPLGHSFSFEFKMSSPRSLTCVPHPSAVANGCRSLGQYSCLKNPMDRGAWQATQSQGSQRVKHDWATEHGAQALSSIHIAIDRKTDTGSLLLGCYYTDKLPQSLVA